VSGKPLTDEKKTLEGRLNFGMEVPSGRQARLPERNPETSVCRPMLRVKNFCTMEGARIRKGSQNVDN